MTSKVDSAISPSNVREPLAVIGIGCRLPGKIDSPLEFWNGLISGRDGICEVPKDRWDHTRFHDTNSEKSGVIRNAKGGFIEGVDQFDGDFFGYFPATAQQIDPQQRLLLEVTHEAMEDAGIRREELGGSRTAVFVGSFMYDYLCMHSATEHRDEINAHAAMGTAICSLSNRISYDFNLKGPSVTLDTACSASLTALHLACQSVWNGDAEMAIAGGVNVMLRPEPSIMLSKGGFLNPDQYCKAFDEAANGYVRGEGVGVAILKPLRKAIEDGDAIYACVRATGANQDGFMPEGFTVPNVFSQVELLKSVYDQAGIDPSTVDFVEAHGTGTSVGDPVECSALGSVLGCERNEQQNDLVIGSVKTNLGHLEGASGITGFIKAVLTAKNGVAPPNLHFNNPNPAIPWEHYRLKVPTEPTPLVSANGPLTVGVNSFGAGGANAHVVVQEMSSALNSAETMNVDNPTTSPPENVLYSICANSREALKRLALRHIEFLGKTSESLENIAYSTFTRRSRYPHMLAITCDSKEQAAVKLQQFADGEVDSTLLTTTISNKKSPKVAFVFSGQGGQWPQMGLRLLDSEPVFRECIEEIDSLFTDLSGWSLLEELRRKKEVSRVNDTVVVQPIVMAIQIGLVKLYAHYGIRPEGVVGHSIGEVAAAYAAGSLTLKQAVEVIYQRSQAQNQASGRGGMLAIGLSLNDAEELIAQFDGVSIGTVNGPKMLTLSGDLEPLAEIEKLMESSGVFCRAVRVQVAYHSHHMEPIQSIMLDALQNVTGTQAAVPLYSTVTTEKEDGTHLDAEYWYRNVREPVLFTETLERMLGDGFDTFIEIGPHPVLVRGGEDVVKTTNFDAILMPSMTRKEPEPTVFLQSLARLGTRGVEPSTETLFGTNRSFVRLPKHPWQHSQHWFETPSASASRLGRYEHPFLKRQTEMVSEEGLAVWEATIGLHKFPYLRDHQVDGEVVFPATGHLELGWAVASKQFSHETFFLENLHFDLPLILPENSRHPLDIRFELVSSDGDYRVCSRPADARADAAWTKHSSGRVNTLHDDFPLPTTTLTELQERFESSASLNVDTFYEKLQDAGMAYSARFQCIKKLNYHDQHWLVELELPDDLVFESQRNFVHPALLDACLHAVFADLHREGHFDRVFLPFRIDRVRFHRQPTQRVWADVHVTRNDEHFLCSDTLIFDENGELVAEIIGLDAKRLVGAGSYQSDRVYEGCFEYQWLPASRESDLYGRVFDTTRAILFADEGGVVDEVEARLNAAGLDTLLIPPHDHHDLDELLEDIPLDRRTLIVFASGLSSQTDQDSIWKGIDQYPSVDKLLHLAQILHRREEVPRLFVITNSTAAVDGDQRLDLGQAVLHGMSRVIRNECPQVSLGVVDLSEKITVDEVDSLMEELLTTRRDQDESEVAIRGKDRFVRCLVGVDRDSAEQTAASIESGLGGNYRAELAEQGGLEHVVFRQGFPNVLGDLDVEMEVEAASLNHKDISNVLGMLPETAVFGGLTEKRLGWEVAGRVVRTGSKVQAVSVGDEVVARVPEGFRGKAVTSEQHVVRRPDSLTPSQAAAVPLAFTTAWYSLSHLARLSEGETVLIHCATGGVGEAAIQIARHAGAKIIATAGSSEKRDHLRQQGIEHVFDSRSLDFYNPIMKITDGRGVDVVLNSLKGRFVKQSMKCLAPFGRFIELGKSDIYRNSTLTLERLGENISYFVVDMDRLAAQKPNLHRSMMTDVIEMFERGELSPHEITEYPISQLRDAIKFMTRSAHQGKIVLNMQDDRVHALPATQAEFRPDRSYLITGGASGLGLEVARWMADRGARQLVLVSRSGFKRPEDEAVVDKMRESGVKVMMPRVDISDAKAIRELIDQVGQELSPLAGVIHGAAVMDDASIPAMNLSRFKKVFQPKGQGAWNLHAATVDADVDLDFFLLFSSISSVLGFVGQVNYAAANFFQDALAQHRRQQGLPATSVNLGVLGEFAGLSRSVNEDQDVIGLLESQGLLVMTLAEVLAKLEAVMIQKPNQRMISKIDWPWFRVAYPQLARDARFIDLLGDAAMARTFRPKNAGLRAELEELEVDEKCERIETEIQAKLAQILGASPDKLDVSESIDVLGLDSLMLTDLQIWIVRLLDITLPLIKLLKGPSIRSLSAELVADLDEGGDLADGQSDQAESEFTLADLDEVEILNPWLIRGACDSSEPSRMICFHSMGVGASLFTKFLINPPEGYDILAVQTPGRENRLHEAPTEQFDELLDEIVPLLEPLFDRHMIFWGHSFGGIVGWEVMRRLRDEYHLQPDHFVVTGTAAPHLMNRWQNREVLLKALVEDNSPEYLMSLSRYVDDPEFIKAILPGMRRDFPLLKNYRYRDTDAFSCPITAMAARQDDFVYTDEIREWARHTSVGFNLIEVEGDHWFLDRNRDLIMSSFHELASEAQEPTTTRR